MFRISLRHPLLALTLVLTLSSAASAAPVSWGSFLTEEGPGILRLLQGAFPGGFHLKSGCGINPDGQPLCAPKHGCGISPDGKPLCSPAVPKSGCGIDPAGKPLCSAVVTPKRGCAINPDGLTVCTP